MSMHAWIHKNVSNLSYFFECSYFKCNNLFWQNKKRFNIPTSMRVKINIYFVTLTAVLCVYFFNIETNEKIKIIIYYFNYQPLSFAENSLWVICKGTLNFDLNLNQPVLKILKKRVYGIKKTTTTM